MAEIGAPAGFQLELGGSDRPWGHWIKEEQNSLLMEPVREGGHSLPDPRAEVTAATRTGGHREFPEVLNLFDRSA
jgi:hypothetical protein